LKNEYSVWRPSGLTITALVIGLVLLLAGAFVAGYVPLRKRDATVRAEADERARALPSMEVIRVGRAAGENDIQLPGTMQAITEAPILARADGYLKRRLVDIGDRVMAGQVLAEIDAPELDQQIKQVEASVAQAEAASEQAEANLEQ
jgi:multidrug efflux pump subunit AcrA (membrane-fusion protein)